jgi:small GTP-binding protein
MTKQRVLTTAGVGIKDTSQLKSYVELMKDNLNDTWLLADDFIESHVCFIRNDYLDKVSKKNKDKSQTLVILNRKKGLTFYDYKYQINPPITARKVEYILNKISKEIPYSPLNTNNNEEVSPESFFSSVFSKIKKSLVGNEELNTNSNTIQTRRTNEFNRLSQKMDVKDAIQNKIIFIGSPGSGKSTFIHTASQNENLEKEINSSLGIDIATMQMQDGIKLSLIGTPGEASSDFIWDIIGVNASAYIIVLDLSRPEIFEYLKKYLSYIKSKAGKVKNLFCILTHSDNTIENLQHVTSELKKNYPFIICSYVIDTRKLKHVNIVMEDIYKKSIPSN